MKSIFVFILLLAGCGPNRWLTPDYTYYVKIEKSPGAVVVLPFWSGDMPSTEKYDTTQTPQFSAEIPLIPKEMPNPRSFEVPPDTGSIIYIWSAKRGFFKQPEPPFRIGADSCRN